MLQSTESIPGSPNDRVEMTLQTEAPPPPASNASAVDPSGVELTTGKRKKMTAKKAVKEMVIRTKPLKLVFQHQKLHAIIVLCTLAALTFLYLLFYSAVFVGSDGLFITYYPWEYVIVCLAVGFFLLFFFLLLDAGDWHNRPCIGDTAGRVLQGVGLVSVSGFTLVGALLSAETYPAYPLAVFIFCFPLLSILLKRALFEFPHHNAAQRADMNERAFALISLAYKLICVGSIIVWLVWLHSNNYWSFDEETRQRLKTTHQCNLTHEDITDRQLTCNAAFLLWVSPIILAAASLVFSIFFSLIAIKARFDTGISSNLANAIGVMLLICAFGIWCAASIAGAGMRLAHSVMAICGAAFVALTLVLLFSLQSTDGAGQLTLVTAKVLAYCRTSEWARAVLVYGCSPLFGLYLVFAFCNQVLRKCGASFGVDKCMCRPPDQTKPAAQIAAEHGIVGASPAPRLDAVRGWVNSSAASVLEEIYETEHKTQVLTKTMLLAVLAWGVSFGSTVTFIGLAGLIKGLKTLDLAVVVVLFLLIGTLMFLIPVVPGLAVYLCGGILMVQVAREQDFAGGGESGFYMACLLATALCYFMKLLAHVLQQKIFGEAMGTYVAIRSAVGINSPLMRAIKFILMQPGLTLGKVCVLCGGPDWPTSVICGILRRADPASIDTVQLLIGLLPMIALIAPTVMAAAFQLRTNDDGPYEAVATVALVTCTALQFLAFIGMTHLVSEVLAHDDTRAVIEAYPEDATVSEYEKAQEAKVRATRHATRLGDLRPVWRWCVLGSTACVTTSSYLVLFMPSSCFAEFALSRDKIEDMCFWSGCSNPFLKPLGLLCLVAVTVGLAGWRAFAQCGPGAGAHATPAPPASDASGIRTHGLVTESQ
mmetsp:Transcript_32895/g.96848  ORF Transcript_32895/g.96848 Transcript_32895/m.96848 type:complete len:877 (-) Transcript_32895:220-2850(-)